MITEEMIPKIEQALGFQLHDWQKYYLLGKKECRVYDAENEKMFAFSSEYDVNPREYNICATYSTNIIVDDLLYLNEKLSFDGFETRLK